MKVQNICKHVEIGNAYLNFCGYQRNWGDQQSIESNGNENTTNQNL
jgi:hypothetical protein